MNKRIGAAWLFCVVVIAAITARAIDSAPIAGAASHVFTNGRDLGILAGVVVAFMLIVWLVVASESRRRERSARMVTEALQTQAFTLAQSVHNIIEHNSQMSVAADKRIDKFIDFAKGRPCFMAEDARDLLREASRARRVVADAADVAAGIVVDAAQHARGEV